MTTISRAALMTALETCVLGAATTNGADARPAPADNVALPVNDNGLVTLGYEGVDLVPEEFGQGAVVYAATLKAILDIAVTGDNRVARADALMAGVSAALTADSSLGGLAEEIIVTAFDRTTERPAEGGRDVEARRIALDVTYHTTQPIS